VEVALVGVEALSDGVVEVAFGVEVGGAAAFLFFGVDASEDLARGVAAVVEVELFEDAGDDGALVGVVVDDEVALEAGCFVLAAEEADAGGVKGADPEVFDDVFAEQAAEAVLHFAGSFVGEGDGEDAVGRDAVGGDEVGNAVDDDAGLAAAGASEDEQGAVCVGDGADLGFVELGYGRGVFGRVEVSRVVHGPWLARHGSGREF